MRFFDWPERLAGYVAATRARPFAWGVHDCCTWAAGAVRAIGGPDLGRGWAGGYVDADGADAAIDALGYDLEAAMERVCVAAGLQEIRPNLAQRGDLLVLRDRLLIRGQVLVAVCNGRDALAATHRGLLALPMRVAVRGWAVT